MDDLSPVQFWIRRTGFIAIGALLLVQALIPLDLTANRIPGPDVMYCVTMAYIVRRPQFAPLWAIVGVFFLRDVLSMAPLGIWTLLILASTELVRANLQAFREYFFGLEWLWITAIFGAMLLVQQIILSITLSFTPNFVDLLLQFLFTAALYPVIVAAMKYGFRIDRPAAGKTDARGHKL